MMSTDNLHSRLQQRVELYGLIRNFFVARMVLEVETPILSMAGNTDPNIESFHCTFDGHIDAGSRTRWLRTSPEHPLKRLLAAGVGDCFELGKVFRNGEVGRHHNPEFSMLEWYRVGWDHYRLMDEVAELIGQVLAVTSPSITILKLTYRELFLAELQLDPWAASLSQLQQPLLEYHISPAGLERDDWLDLLFSHILQPRFPRDRLTLIYDYPASQCALAQICNQSYPFAERFEAFVGSLELANGYHELRDSAEQRRRFQRDLDIRQRRGRVQPPIDEGLLSVLDHLPDCAGVAMGIDRLLLARSGTRDMQEMLVFPFAQA